jgi:hypothetical protein
MILKRVFCLFLYHITTKKIYHMKKYIPLVITSLLLFTAWQASGQPALIGYWNFNQGAGGSPWNAPIAANQGEGNARITAGTWTWGDINYTEGFAGNTVNALGGDPAGASLSLRNDGMNGKYIQIEFSMQGYASLEISYWSRRTSTGFNNNQWSWSTDGENFTSFGSVVNPSDQTAGALVSIPALSALDNAPTAYLRYTLNGATSAAGNNRIDNLQLNAQVAGDPDQVSTPVFNPPAGTYFSPQQVSISTSTSNASIYYTTNGNEPGQGDRLYDNTPIEVDEDMVIKARAFKQDMEPSNVASAAYTIRKQLLKKDFEDGSLTSGGWSVYNITEGANTWVIDAFAGITYAYITEYESNPPNPHSWFISPETDLSDMEEVIFTFMNQAAHRTGDALSVKISQNYDGSGNPAQADWTTLQATYDSHTGAGFGTWTSSGEIDLSAFSGKVYIGFEYKADNNNFGRWHLNNIEITGKEATISNNANLSVFAVGGINVLNLSGLRVNNPESDQGATLFVEDFDGFAGISIETAHPLASLTLTLNGTEVDENDMADLPIAEGDVIVASVVAENTTTTQHYKVTASQDNRSITLISPVGGESFETYDEITFSWESENISQLLMEVMIDDNGTDITMIEMQVEGGSGSYTETVPNGVHGQFKWKLSDLNDPNKYEESGYFSLIDIVEPELLSLSPEHEAENVSISTDLQLVFNEEFIFPGTGSIHLHKLSDNSLVESISADSDRVHIAYEVVDISLSADLEYGTTYYVLIDNNAFRDMGDNYFAGLAGSGQWSFATAEEPGLICNGDFEFWTAGVPDCWYGNTSNIGEANVVQYSSNVYSGNHAVQLINATGTHRRFTTKPTTVENGVVYTISFYVKGKGDIRTGLYDNRPGDSFGYAPYNDYIIINSNEWVKYTQQIAGGNNFSQAEFIFSVRNTDPANNHLLIDLVSIEQPRPESVSNIAEFRNAEPGGVYTINGEAIVTFKQDLNNQIYLQDATAAILVHDPNGIITTSYAVGQGITGITGTLEQHFQMLRLLPESDPGNPSSSGNTVTPELRTLQSLTSADQAKLLKIENVSFTQTASPFQASTNYTITSPNGNGVFRTFFPAANYINTSIPTVPQVLTVLVNQYQNEIQVAARSLADFETYVNVRDHMSLSGVRVFPNPFHAFIQLQSESTIDRVVVVNLMGQVVIDHFSSASEMSIPAANLQSGMYILHIYQADGRVQTTKIIKKE